MKISAVILTKNEEENIKKVCKDLDFASEIVVVDDYSNDKTREYAKQAGKKKVRIYKRHLNGDFAAQRNYGLAKAKHEWILFVDADERINSLLAEELKELLGSINKSRFKGFYINRIALWYGRELKHGEWNKLNFLTKWGNNRVLRLAQKNGGKWKRKVHEHWDVSGKIGDLENPILHIKDEGVSEILRKINFQSKLHARANCAEGKKASVFKIIFMPGAKFFVNYFVKMGFRDGVQGFLMAVLMSFHSFLGWSRLWLMEKK